MISSHEWGLPEIDVQPDPARPRDPTECRLEYGGLWRSPETWSLDAASKRMVFRGHASHNGEKPFSRLQGMRRAVGLQDVLELAAWQDLTGLSRTLAAWAQMPPVNWQLEKLFPFSPNPKLGSGRDVEADKQTRQIGFDGLAGESEISA